MTPNAIAAVSVSGVVCVRPILSCSLGVRPPIYALLSLVAARGFEMGAPDFRRHAGHPIVQDVIQVPEVSFTEFPNRRGITDALRPAFDLVWNACGYAKSANYNADGEWIPP